MKPVLISAALFFVFRCFIGVPVARACDVIGCTLSGHEQDVLAIVKVLSREGDDVTVNVEHVYDQSRITPAETITIIPAPGVDSPVAFDGSVGSNHLLSLSCNDAAHCYQKWGSWEVTESESIGWKLKEIRFSDDAFLQWFLDGKEGSFYGISDRGYVRLPDGSCMEIYPKEQPVVCDGEEEQAQEEHRSLWIEIAAGFLGASIMFVLVKGRFKKR